MDDRRTLWIEVELDDKGVPAKLTGIKTSGEAAAKSLDQHRSVGGRLSNTYTELASKVSLVRQLWATATDVMSAPINAAKEETARNVELVAALKARGEATAANIASLNSLANAQSFALAVDDEAITKIQTVGLNLGKVALEDMPLYVRAVEGYAELSGKSYESAAQIVSKFVSGASPKIKGLALDVEKTASAHDKLNLMVPATAGAYQALIDKANTFEGGQVRMRNAWDNALAAAGKMLTTSPAVINMLQSMAKWIQDGAEWLEKHPDAITKAGEKMQEWFKSDGPVQTSLKDLAMIIKEVAELFRWVAENGPKVAGAVGFALSPGEWGKSPLTRTFERTQRAQEAQNLGPDEGEWVPLPDGSGFTRPELLGNYKGVSRSRAEAPVVNLPRSRAAAPGGAPATVHIGSLSSQAATQLARAIAGQGNLIFAEAGVG